MKREKLIGVIIIGWLAIISSVIVIGCNLNLIDLGNIYYWINAFAISADTPSIFFSNLQATLPREISTFLSLMWSVLVIICGVDILRASNISRFFMSVLCVISSAVIIWRVFPSLQGGISKEFLLSSLYDFVLPVSIALIYAIYLNLPKVRRWFKITECEVIPPSEK